MPSRWRGWHQLSRRVCSWHCSPPPPGRWARSHHAAAPRTWLTKFWNFNTFSSIIRYPPFPPLARAPTNNLNLHVMVGADTTTVYYVWLLCQISVCVSYSQTAAPAPAQTGSVFMPLFRLLCLGQCIFTRPVVQSNLCSTILCSMQVCSIGWGNFLIFTIIFLH